jgi:hypothetical protein
MKGVRLLVKNTHRISASTTRTVERMRKQQPQKEAAMAKVAKERSSLK